MDVVPQFNHLPVEGHQYFFQFLAILSLFFFYKFIYFIYLFLAALGLCCCAWAFSSCGECGLLFVAVRRLLIAVASLVVEHGLQARRLQQLRHKGLVLWLVGSRVQAWQLWRTGLVAPWHVRSSRTRARTRVPCIGRQILNHCATREAFKFILCCWFSCTGSCVKIKFLFLQDKCPGVQMLGCVFRFLRNCQTVFQSGCAILRSYQQCMSVPVSPHLLQLLVLSIFKFQSF